METVIATAQEKKYLRLITIVSVVVPIVVPLCYSSHLSSFRCL